MEASTETVEGYSNYATFGVDVTLSNDAETAESVMAQVKAYRLQAPDHINVTEGIWTADQALKFELADWLRDYTRELCGLEGNSLSPMAQQMLEAGLSEVNWEEVAETWL